MQRSCANAWCRQSFEIIKKESALRERLAIVINGKEERLPDPTLCPDCRQQRRIAWRNERNLYRNTCAKCHRSIISAYSPEKPSIVYCHDCWWSDSWDPKTFGRPLDLGRPLFLQIGEVIRSSPHLALINSQSENSEFTHCASYNKDCYMCFAAVYDQRCLYVNNAHKNADCTDCLALHSCELCYECVNCQRCYACSFAQDCMACSSCSHVYDCQSCTDCFCCTGLRNKRYCFMNDQLQEKEYKAKIASLNLGSEDVTKKYRLLLVKMKEETAAKFAHCEHAEESSGDYLSHAKRCLSCFDAINTEDGMYLYNAYDSNTCMDAAYIDSNSEMLYEALSVASKRSIGDAFVWFSNDCHYSFNCHHCADLFGCAQMRNARYCILNTQYSKEEYFTLMQKIIERMRHENEWGEFFPPTMSPFAYNETVAQEFFPLTQEDVLKNGWRWKTKTDDMPEVVRTIPGSELPSSIDDIPDDILNWAIQCETTKRPFKIVKQELEFHRKMRLPIPRLHPDERHKRRMAQRNPRKLWKRTCMKCEKGLETTYAPERPEKVYCEACYLKAVY